QPEPQSLASVQSFSRSYPCAADNHLITVLDAYCRDFHKLCGLLFHVIVYPQIAKAQLPGCQRIGAHLFSVPGLHRWLVHQLLVYTSKDNGTLPRSEKVEMSNRRLHILNAIGQMLGLLSCRTQH